MSLNTFWSGCRGEIYYHYTAICTEIILLAYTFTIYALSMAKTVSRAENYCAIVSSDSRVSTLTIIHRKIREKGSIASRSKISVAIISSPVFITNTSTLGAFSMARTLKIYSADFVSTIDCERIGTWGNSAISSCVAINTLIETEEGIE